MNYKNILMIFTIVLMVYIIFYDKSEEFGRGGRGRDRESWDQENNCHGICEGKNNYDACVHNCNYCMGNCESDDAECISDCENAIGNIE